jgi:tetratricopeptide (TPR) repeat protein
MDHYYFPSEVWVLFNKYFSWSTKKERLSIKFPKNFIEFVVNKINYPGYFDYKSLLLCRENMQEEFMDQYSRASGALDDYNLYDTVKSIGVCREICPDHPDLQILEARYLMANGSMDEADTILHSLIERDNRNVFAYVFRGHLFYRLGKYAEACDEYKKAWNCIPTQAKYWLLSANAVPALRNMKRPLNTLTASMRFHNTTIMPGLYWFRHKISAGQPP